MEDIEKLKRRLIENQDIIFYFAYNSYIEMLFYGDVDLEFPIQPVNLADFIKDNPDVIDGLQMRNIVNLLAISSKESFPFDIEQIILKKLENGERFFSGNNFESNAFGNIQTSFDMAFNSNLMSDDTANFIKQKIYADLDRLKEKDLEVANLINNAKTIYAIDNFINTYQKGWTREKQAVLEELCRENINVLDIINYEIFEDEFFYGFSPEFVKHIAKYPNESSKLLIIKRNYPELFEAEKKMILEFEKEPMPEKYALEKILIDACCEEASKLKKKEFSKKDIIDLINFYKRKKVWEFGAVNVNFQENYEQAFEEACDKAFYDAKTQEYRTVDDMRQIFVTKYFGMGIKETEKFLSAYIENSEEIELPSDIKDYMREIKEVFEIGSKEELAKRYESEKIKITPIDKIKYELSLRRAYSKEFVQQLDKTDKKLKVIDPEFIEFDGKQIPKIRLTGDFDLLFSSTDTGFREDKKLVDGSFLKTYKHTSDVSKHLISTCSVNQDFLGCTPVNKNGVMIVFSTVYNDKLSLYGITDINSNIRSFDYSAEKSYYIPYEKVHQFSRKVYAEAAIEKENTYPNYIAVFTDSPKEIKDNSYKAALEFGVPILEIDKKEIALEQINRLNNLMEIFKKTKDMNILHRLISMYETNVAGWLLNRDENVEDKSLTSSIDNSSLKYLFDEKRQEIYEIIKLYIDELRGTEEFDSKTKNLISILQSEADKYDLINLDYVPITKTASNFKYEYLIGKINMIRIKEKQNTFQSENGTSIIIPCKPIVSLQNISQDLVNSGIKMEEIVKANELVIDNSIERKGNEVYE